MFEIDVERTDIIYDAFMHLISPLVLLRSHLQLDKRIDENVQTSASFQGDRVTILRIVSTSASGVSIIACLLMFYFYFAMHRKALKLRHRLITFLIFFDLLRSVAIIIYPILTFVTTIGGHRYVVNFLGFFTATAIEGGDLAILSFALYSLISIYYPNGGREWLSSKRYYIYLGSFVIPLVMASIGLAGKGYQPLQVYCYLPGDPLWYRLVLSWGPRYFIMIAISIIYFYIYYYVRSQLKKLENEASFSVMDVSGVTQPVREKKDPNAIKVKRSCFERLTNRMLNIDDEDKIAAAVPPSGNSNSNFNFNSNTNSTNTANDSLAYFDINHQLQMSNQIKLKNRYRQITRQMAEILLYPIAYFLIWIFPLIAQAIVMKDPETKYSTSWGIGVLATVSIPISGFVDALVFFYRERPWQYTFEYYDIYHTHDKLDFHNLVIPKWRIWLKWLPFYGIPQEYFYIKEIQKSFERSPSALTLDVRVVDSKNIIKTKQRQQQPHSSSRDSFNDYLGPSGQVSMHSSNNNNNNSNGNRSKDSSNMMSSIDAGFYEEEIGFLDILRNGPGG